MNESLQTSLANAIGDTYSSKDEQLLHNTIGKVVCVGRNYAAHARELGNEVPSAPILFMKPASSVMNLYSGTANNKIIRPDASTYGETHYEAELCIQLSANLNKANAAQAQKAIGAVTLGLDLTLRDLQSKLKDKGQPWERAKCFDGACVLADWVAADKLDLNHLNYQLYINNEIKQDGDSALMLFPIYGLIAEISHAFSLQAGDVIMTGTPSGVGVLQADDELKLVLGNNEWHAKVL